MRGQQSFQNHIDNLNKSILIIEGLGYSEDYDRFMTVLHQLVEDLKKAGQEFENLRHELWTRQIDEPIKVSRQFSGILEADSNEKPTKSTAIEPQGIQADCPTDDGCGGGRAA